jgi:tyrosinase
MVNIRQNVWDMDEWADPVLWYARGVEALKARPLDEPTSWRFYAAIHGVDGQRWSDLGYLRADDQIPEREVQQKYFAQCQHGSWYFLPWHRGYLLAFENVVRAAIVELGGPAGWALPYWNYFKAGQSALPVAFASPDWPDGEGTNPLFVEQRWGPFDDGNVFVPLQAVNLNAMSDPDFTGVSNGGSTGFGGVDTGFAHGGSPHGGIETQPHDWTHGLVGGSMPGNPNFGGVMSDPDTAGLDPIFWLHHANIDRLWDSWVKDPDANHANPTDSRWLDGPQGDGERVFVLPLPGDEDYEYTARDVLDVTVLGYEYDDLSPTGVPAPVPDRLAARRERLGLAVPAEGVGAVAGDAQNVELVGSNDESVPVRGAVATSRVSLEAGMRSKVARSLSGPAGMASGDVTPDRLFLNLENVRGQSDAAAFNVYVGVPDDDDVADHPDQLAGSIAPFGLRRASLADGEQAGQGLTFVLEITDIVDKLHLEDSFDVDDLEVRIVPVKPVADEADVSIGRMSIYRQGT